MQRLNFLWQLPGCAVTRNVCCLAARPFRPVPGTSLGTLLFLSQNSFTRDCIRTQPGEDARQQEQTNSGLTAPGAKTPPLENCCIGRKILLCAQKKEVKCSILYQHTKQCKTRVQEILINITHNQIITQRITLHCYGRSYRSFRRPAGASRSAQATEDYRKY